MKTKAYIGLGSNRGNKLQYLASAILLIKDDKNCRLIKKSSIYESKAFGNTNQEIFFNAVIKIETDYVLKDLFVFLKGLENFLGRVQSEQWGPREIDLDILLFGEIVFSDDIITVPHKGLLKRDFVILPLLEIEPEIVHPVNEKKIREMNLLVVEKNIISKISNTLLT